MSQNIPSIAKGDCRPRVAQASIKSFDATGTTFLVVSRIALITALPIIKEFLRRGLRIYLASTAPILAIVHSILPDASIEFVDLDILRHKNRWINRLHKLALCALTPDNFSNAWPRYLEHQRQKLSLLERMVFCWLRKLPKAEPRLVNNCITKLLQPFCGNLFPTERIVNFTVMGGAQFLCAPNQKVFSILESWDQPSKYPIGYTSANVFVWNRHLKQDWQKHQGGDPVSIFYPIKMHYVLQTSKIEMSSLAAGISPRLMYPAAFATNSFGTYFEEECILIDELCTASHKLGCSLLIKPKPNGTPGEYNRIISRYDHVKVGAYQESRDGSDYLLDDAYNHIRIKELEVTDLVINLGTTFAMDATAFGVAVAQLCVRNKTKYPALSALMGSFHLQQHFLGKEDLVFSMGVGQNMTDLLGEILEDYRQGARIRTLSGYLQQWIIPESTLDEAILKIVNECAEN